MFKLFGNKRLFILLIGLICFIALMGLTLEQRSKLIWPEKFVKDSISWMQSFLYKPAEYAAGLFQDIHDLTVVYQENKVLKQTLARYAKDTAKLNEMEAENIRLKEALSFTEQQKQANQYTYRIAQVIGTSPDPYNNTIVINLGERNGIKENMAVVSTDGLIGRIDSVSGFSSNVQLLSGIEDSGNVSKAIAATVKGKEGDSYGIIENYDLKSGMLIMTKIPQTDPLQEGDTVVTSGLGQIFPGGIEIGKVVSKSIGDFGITYKAMIAPFSSFHHLREVFVVEVPEQG
ncbi:MAG: cell-shape determining protein [Paenibacillaceae bacterium]|nr:cell-shape determining protein [Paenibacillaceae bacterium]